MKSTLAKGFALLAAFAGMSAAAQFTRAQELAPGEYIVGSEQVISDNVISGGSTLSDGSYVTGDSYATGDSYVSGDSTVSGDYIGDMSAADAGVGCIERGYGRPDLFYNYYTRGMCNRANAQMYLSPLPVPPNVGHTFFTYQPFYPEEMLYWHKNRYHNYYDNGRGMNRTRAVYWAPPVRQAASNLYWNYLRIPR